MVRSVIDTARPLADRVDPARTALIVIDVQNDFCHPQGAFAQAGADLSDIDGMAENVARLVDAARDCGAFIVWVRATYDTIVQGAPLADRLNRRPGYGRGPCLEGSFGAEWYGRVAPRAVTSEAVVTKHRNSAFWDTPIDLYLRANGIDSVILTGTATSGCVDSNARDAFFRDYHILLASDACGSYSRARHDAALAKLGYSYGQVVPTDAILEAWRHTAPGPRGWQAAAKAMQVPRDERALIDPAATALVVVDAGLDGGDAIRRLVRAGRSAGVLVIQLRTEAVPQAAAPGWQGRVERFALAGPPTAAGGESADLVVTKHRESGFLDTRLETMLRANAIRSVVLAGSDAGNGVDATARDSAMRDFNTIVVADAIEDEDEHRAAMLAALGRRYAVLLPSAEVLAVWSGREVRALQAGAA